MKTNYRQVLGGVIFLAAALAGAADYTMKPVKPAAKPAAVASRPIPHEQVVDAGAKLARMGGTDESAARNAAQMLLAANNRPLTNLEVEQLAVLILTEANKDAGADLKAQMEVVKQRNADKKALRDAPADPKARKDGAGETIDFDQVKLQQLQDRKSQFEKLLSDMTRKASATSDSVTKNMK